MLPNPDCVFTIPSLHDGLELDGRLYFPRRRPGAQNVYVKGFGILAHPYAPLGGSWDDPVVQAVGSTMLKSCFVLITFNFRGAGRSHGKTSWMGNAEVADYVSFLVLALFFINASDVVNHVETATSDPSGQPALVLGGYSYGSLIASCLPPVALVSSAITKSTEGTVEFEIATRASKLSKVFLGFLESQAFISQKSLRQSETKPPMSPSRGVIMGGYESEAAGRRLSRESLRRSFDADSVRRSVEKVKQKFTSVSSASSQDTNMAANGARPLVLSILPRISFLLVSPLLFPISGFITLFSRPSYRHRDMARDTAANRQQTNLLENPSLAIYGDEDMFTSVRGLRKWSRNLEATSNSTFTYKEITGAGHFWKEIGTESHLCHEVAQWLVKSVMLTAEPQI